MGGICPCPRRRKNKQYPYDVHEETFEIEDNVGHIGELSPNNEIGESDNNVLTEDIRTSHDSIDRSPHKEENKPINDNSKSFQSEELVNKEESTQALGSTDIPMKQQKQEEPVEKKVEQPPKPQMNILKSKAIRKKYNPDDYRFKDQVDEFKIKKIDSIKQQQYNIDNCKNSAYFIFDITANVYIDDCQNCFIFIGPCQSTIFVRNCKKMTIVAVTGQFRTYQCHQCQFSLYCKSQPVVQSSSELVFSSFQAPVYQQLAHQMGKKKFVPWNNHWSEIHNFTKKEGEQHYLLKENIDLSAVNWAKAFQMAELPIAQLDNPVPLIMGDLPYEPKKVLLIMLNQQIETNTALKVLRGAVILKANQGVMQGEGKAIKTAVLIDCLDFMPEKYQQIGKVFENLEEIEEKKEKWFISFGDSREK